MGSRSTRGRNGGVPPGKWYGALRQQVHGRWIAYVYDLNGKVTIWHSCFNTADEAKHALDRTALGLHGKPTDVNFSGPAAAPPPMSGAALESWQREGGAVLALRVHALAEWWQARDAGPGVHILAGW
jgi:hypothetical protein